MFRPFPPPTLTSGGSVSEEEGMVRGSGGGRGGKERREKERSERSQGGGRGRRRGQIDTCTRERNLGAECRGNESADEDGERGD